jgi:uncharacterized protein (DUF1015 family)
MILVKPFRGLRPRPELASVVASEPYDVVSREEAIEEAEGNSISFFHINKPEVGLPPEVNLYSEAVYEKGRDNLCRFVDEGTLVRDQEERFYVYKQVMEGHSQVGIVVIASLDAYERNLIKKHEFTRPDKENDRVAHMDALNAQVGPVFLTYRAREEINVLVKKVLDEVPENDFVASNNVRHIFWVVKGAEEISCLERALNSLDSLYVADGHHRSAAAARVRQLRIKNNPHHNGNESYNYFLSVLFPHDQMQILDYNRVVMDLNGMSATGFLEELAVNFDITNIGEGSKPRSVNEFHLYLDRCWYRLKANEGLIERVDFDDQVVSLDVSILQDWILTPLLGIKDQRTDSRIDFVGGVRGMSELEKRVDSGGCAAAFALFPTRIDDLLRVADADKVMPPKSTWFEPKLKSGLVTHILD